jgi:MoxR-like ATPase
MPAARKFRPVRLLQSLHIFGLDHLDPVVLAALADARPMLLVGPHGTAKSELLNRVARALGLEHRHYNASLISFDDLLGYPVPNAERTGLEYLRTPGDLWSAESVFLDEISRCRPETQNKLFSIVHERRVQGLELARLRYRWAAMNPPACTEDGDPMGEEAYLGSLPLDPALADRFPWVLEVPALGEMGVKARRQILSRGGLPPEGDAGLPRLVAAARGLLDSAPDEILEWSAAYVDALVLPLREAGLTISGRRAVALCRSVLAVHAASEALGASGSLADYAFLALKWGLPQRAQGKSVRDATLAGVHKLALKTAGEPESSAWHTIRRETDPVRRIAAALGAPRETVDRLEVSQLVADAYAGLPVPERYALAWILFPVFARRDRLTSATYELLAEPVGKVLSLTEEGEKAVETHRRRAAQWDKVLATVSRLEREGDPQAADLGNILYTLFAVENEDFDPETVVARYREWRTLFADFVLEEAA